MWAATGRGCVCPAPLTWCTLAWHTPPIRGVIPLFKYELCFMGGTDTRVDVTVVEVEATEYEDDYLGDGDNSVPSVVFVKDVPDPEDPDETASLKVFELPAHRVIYIKNLGELDEPKARCLDEAEPTDPEAAKVDPGTSTGGDGAQYYVNAGAASND